MGFFAGLQRSYVYQYQKLSVLAYALLPAAVVISILVERVRVFGFKFLVPLEISYAMLQIRLWISFCRCRLLLVIIFPCSCCCHPLAKQYCSSAHFNEVAEKKLSMSSYVQIILNFELLV